MAKQPFRRIGVINPIPQDGMINPDVEKVLEDIENTDNFLENKPGIVDEIASGEHRLVEINKLYPGKFQPRFSIDGEKIDDLASDIARIGQLLNPINVLPDTDDRYEIIAGERRWRACLLLGWSHIPVTFVKGDRRIALMASLSENLQRQNLSDMEIGFSLKRMIEENIAPTKKELAVKLGMDRRDLYRYLSFTSLPDEIQKIIRENHALFSSSAAEIMDSLCRRGFQELVERAAKLILEGKLNASAIHTWVTGRKERTSNTEKRSILRHGSRIGTISFTKDEMRIRLSPQDIKDITPEEITESISSVILSELREFVVQNIDSE